MAAGFIARSALLLALSEEIGLKRAGQAGLTAWQKKKPSEEG